METDPDWTDDRRALVRLARSLSRNEHEAEDVVQEFLALEAQRPSNLRGNRGAWIRTVLRRLVQRRAVQERRRREREQIVSRLPRVQASPVDQLSAKELANDLGDAVARLREPYREVIGRRFFEGQTPQEISNDLGRPLPTVKSQLQRGLEMLRVTLEGSDKREHWFTAWIAGWLGLRGGSKGAKSLAAVGILIVISTISWKVMGGRSEPSDPLRGSEGLSVANDRDESPMFRAEEGNSLPSRAESEAEVVEFGVLDPSIPELETPWVRVVDEAGKPLQGAAVYSVISRFDRLLGTTDENGTFQEPRPVSMDKAKVRIRADLAGFTSSEELVLTEQERTLTLTLGRMGFTWRGRIVDQDGQPVSGCRVQLRGQSPEEPMRPLKLRVVHSDSLGEFEFKNLRPADLEFFCRADGFADLRRAGRWRSASEAPEEIVLERSVTFRGTLRDEAGEPLAGLEIYNEVRDRIQRRSTTSDADGNFVLDGLGPGQHHIWAGEREKRLNPSSQTGNLMAHTTVNLIAGENPPWNPTLKPRLPLLIRVVDEEGQPSPGRPVFVRQLLDQGLSIRTLRTDVRGQVAYYDRYRAPLEVLVGTEEFRRGIQDDHFVVEAHTQGVVELRSSKRTRFEFRGHVDQGADSRVGARPDMVLLVSTAGGMPAVTRVQPDGTFRFEGVPKGSFRVFWRDGNRGVEELGSALVGNSFGDPARFTLSSTGALKIETASEMLDPADRLVLSLHADLGDPFLPPWLSHVELPMEVMSDTLLLPGNYHLSVRFRSGQTFSYPIQISSQQSSVVRISSEGR